MNILYEEEGSFKIGAILADNDTSLQVEAPHGKRSKVKSSNVLFRFNEPLAGFMTKQRIFEIYLNIIEWGNSVYGAEAASRYYFNHSAANLDAWEAARLAAMVPKPRYYDRNRDTPWLDAKTNLILERMPSAQVP